MALLFSYLLFVNGVEGLKSIIILTDHQLRITINQ